MAKYQIKYKQKQRLKALWNMEPPITMKKVCVKKLHTPQEAKEAVDIKQLKGGTMINPVGRPRKISNDNLNAIKKMVIAKKLSVKKVSIIKGFKYGSVIAAANALNHSLRSVVKVYAIRATA